MVLLISIQDSLQPLFVPLNLPLLFPDLILHRNIKILEILLISQAFSDFFLLFLIPLLHAQVQIVLFFLIFLDDRTLFEFDVGKCCRIKLKFIFVCFGFGHYFVRSGTLIRCLCFTEYFPQVSLILLILGRKLIHPQLLQQSIFNFSHLQNSESLIESIYIIQRSMQRNPPDDSSQNSNLEPITVLLIFLIIVINQIFLISLTTVLLKKVKLVIRSTAKKYYIFVFFYIISKMVFCVILQIKILQGIPDQFKRLDSQNIQLMLKNSLAFADGAIIELFLIAFEHYLALSFSIFGNYRIEKTIKILMQGVQLLSFFTIMIPLLIFNIGVISYETLTAFTSALNCFSVVSFIAGFFFINFKMTGIMMDRRSSEVVKKVYTLLLVALLSRSLMAGVEIWIEVNLKTGSFSDFISILEENQDQIVVLGCCFILYILIILLSEGLPLMMSLRESLIIAMTQTRTVNRNSSILTEDSIREDLLTNFDLEQQSEQKSMRKNSDPRNFSEIQTVHDLEVLKKIKASEDYSVYQAKSKTSKNMYFLRELSNISNYILEEISQELDMCNKANLSCLNNSKVIFDEEVPLKVYIIEDYLPHSLSSILENIVTNHSLKQRIELCIEIAKSIKQFQEAMKNGHGILNPHNIMFDLKNKVKLTGFGMESLKKYLSLTTDYTNITFYTDVDLLGIQRQKTITKAKRSSDIYSFGMICYEIIVGNFKYRELSGSEIREKFKKDNFRPKIPESIPEPLKNLMRKCWQEREESRPDINQVITTLDNLRAQL